MLSELHFKKKLMLRIPLEYLLPVERGAGNLITQTQSLQL